MPDLEEAQTPAPKHRLLIADDDTRLLSYYKTLFNSDGAAEQQELNFFPPQTNESTVDFYAEMFSDGQQLVDYFRAEKDQQRRIPLCLLDMRMSPLDGLRTAELLRDIDPDVILIIATAYSDVSSADIRRHLREDIYYMKKPFNDDELLSLISSLMRSWERHQQLKQTAAQLEYEAHLLHALMDNLPDLIYFKDTQSRFIRVNQSWRNVLNLAQDSEVVGKTDFDVHRPELAPSFYDEELTLLRTGKSVIDREEYFPTTDGEPRWFAANKAPIRDEQNNIIGLVGITRDITTHKLAELKLRDALIKEQELGELRGRLMAIVSHELRTPLATMQAACDGLIMFRDRMTPEDMQMRLEKIQQQIRHMTELHNDVLMLSAVESRSAALHSQQLDLIALLRDLIDQMKVTDQQHHVIKLICDAEKLPIYGYDGLLRQIITNLLSNALKYSAPGSSVRVQVDALPGHYALHVSDHGIGIPEIDLPHVFEPFHRGTNVGVIEGTGLGLAITQAAVERHEGRIEISSQWGSGTTVTVILPHSITKTSV
ncbi:MAG: PAS domain-containing protein [Anaerolineae bacterium]|nr:PAS domain-containing protein [Anaerolineae bacterium]